jgi:hypothetical protein
VYIILSSLNIILIITILALSAFGIRTWVYPKYPNMVDASNKVTSTQKLAPLVMRRQIPPTDSVNEVVGNNLFREERVEYISPNQEPDNKKTPNETPKDTLPPPELALRGVMILNGIKIAILEGTQSIKNEDKIESKSIKRKGYYLGDKIGDYKITEIEKREVKLNSSKGQTLSVKLLRQLINMDKKTIAKNIKPKLLSIQPKIKTKTAPKIKKSASPEHRISGATTKRLPKHISGR